MRGKRPYGIGRKLRLLPLAALLLAALTLIGVLPALAAEEKEERGERRNKQKTNGKVTDLNLTISIIT